MGTRIRFEDDKYVVDTDTEMYVFDADLFRDEVNPVKIYCGYKYGIGWRYSPVDCMAELDTQFWKEEQECLECSKEFDDYIDSFADVSRGGGIEY